jgi:hypothetical protein
MSNENTDTNQANNIYQSPEIVPFEPTFFDDIYDNQQVVVEANRTLVLDMVTARSLLAQMRVLAQQITALIDTFKELMNQS